MLALALAGCSFKSIALKSTVELLDKGTAVFYEESDLKLAEDSLANQVKLVELLLRSDPLNPELTLYAAQGFGAYAFMFLEGSSPERAKHFYERGRAFGLPVLNRRCKLDLLSETDMAKFSKALERLKLQDVPVLFWTAYAWGGWANLSRDNPQALADLPKIEKLMLRVNDLSPGYFYGGADLFLGAYYGSRPKMFGGDLDKAKFYFNRALTVTGGNFLMAQVLCAQHYAVPAQDRGYFKALLDQALSYPAASFPEQRLSNEVAKKRAKKLMENINDYF